MQIDPRLLENLAAALAIILAFIGFHAWADANKHLRDTEALYNKQPRIKPVRAKLKWSGRIMSILSLKK